MPAKNTYPDTPKIPVTDTYHDTTVTDEYRWLENAQDPAVQAWTATQNHHTRTTLDAISERTIIQKRLKTLYTNNSATYYDLTQRGQILFALKLDPSQKQPILVALPSIDDLSTERVIIDPTHIDPTATTTIDFYVPSPDGSLVAISLSQNDTEEGTLYIFETDTGHQLEDQIPRVTYPTAGGHIAWHADGNSFFYTRYPQNNERPPEDQNFYQQIYYHRLSTPTTEDTYEIGREFPRIAEVIFSSSSDHHHILATVLNGTGGEEAHFIHNPDGHWHQITHFEDQITHVTFGPHNTLYLLSHQNAPRGQVLCLPITTPHLKHAQTLITQGQNTIQNITPTTSLLYITEQAGGPSHIRVYKQDGTDQGVIPTEPVSSIGQVLNLDNDTILFSCTSFITPPAWYCFNPTANKPSKTKLATTSPAKFNDVEVTRTFATSKDGTQIPLNIIHKKGVKRNGNNPTVLYAYGGLGISLTPTFQARRQLWMDYGGVFVVANLRGGGEYGEEWHQAGKKTRRQNVFDDFIASAEHLINTGYTSPNKLAIEGRSNGGLLMGVALTQRPNLFQAVVAHVGIYDMLRVEQHPNGACNIPEFGTVKNRDEFDALYAYSPIHCVKDDTHYPAVLLLTGENDGRVDPANSRRMAARLQAATQSDKPILLRTSVNTGHGIGSTRDDQIAEDTDIFTFLLDQLNVI